MVHLSHKGQFNQIIYYLHKCENMKLARVEIYQTVEQDEHPD